MLDRVVAVLWNADSRRARLPWRLALFVAAVVLAAVPLAVLGPALLLAGVPGLAARSPSLVAQGVAFTVAVAVAAVVLDRRRLSDYGLRLGRAWAEQFAVGLALGALLMTGIVAVAVAAGWARVTGVGVGSLPALVSVVVAFCAVGFYEELVARGYLLVNLAEGLQVGPVGPREATALASLGSALVFGAVHLANPNATLASAAGITLAGLFLAAGYVFTGELALPVGVHVTWNLFQGAVYGLPVSGVEVGVTVVSTRLTGPALVTGGRFGPEAGLLGVAASLAGTIAVVAYAGREPDPRVWTPELRWREEEE